MKTAVLATMWFALGIAAGCLIAQGLIYRDAVQRGVGQYSINEWGKAQFTWKTK